MKIYEEIISDIEKYKCIGEGGHRKVFDIGNGLVIKKAIDYNVDIEDSIKVNRSEFDIFKKAKEKNTFVRQYGFRKMACI